MWMMATMMAIAMMITMMVMMLMTMVSDEVFVSFLKKKPELFNWSADANVFTLKNISL